MNMETILFSKTDKIKIVTFAAVAFGLPWLLLPQIRVEGILAYNIPASYMMILPTFGIILGRIICERKIHGWFHWIYTIAFIESTAVMVLCAAKVITGKAADDMLTVSSMALSIVLLLGRMIDEQELYPFKDLKKAIGIYIMFVAIAQIQTFRSLYMPEPCARQMRLFPIYCLCQSTFSWCKVYIFSGKNMHGGGACRDGCRIYSGSAWALFCWESYGSCGICRCGSRSLSRGRGS